MSLLCRLREKQACRCATVTPATFATPEKGGQQTVASVAAVTVAKLRATPAIRQPVAPMTATEEMAIRAWLALIGEIDHVTIAEVIDGCQRDTATRRYFVGRVAAELPKPTVRADDRRTCDQCANLIARRCHAGKRGEIVASRDYEPIRDLLRRCEGYAPGADDPDRRHGRERWPELGAKTS